MSDENEDGLDMWAEAMDEQAASESEEAQAVELANWMCDIVDDIKDMGKNLLGGFFGKK